MKVVFLMAGRGRRLEGITKSMSKMLLQVGEKPLLKHVVDGFVQNGFTEFVPIVGYRGQEVLRLFEKEYGSTINLEPIWNNDYAKTNNLYSLVCAQEVLQGNDFLVCNGDLLCSKGVIRDMRDTPYQSAIAIDDSERDEPIDSPGITQTEGRIFDIGRHIPFGASSGYAIGLYKFGGDLVQPYFERASEILKDNQEAGYHEPLCSLFSKHNVHVVSTNDTPWTDIDVKEDIPIALKVLGELGSK